MKEDEWLMLLIIGFIIVWILWPSSNSSEVITMHAYACVKNTDGAWYAVKNGKDGTCLGTERNLRDGSVSFAVWANDQRVIAKLSDGIVLNLNKCEVFDKSNWNCNLSDKFQWINWEMTNGDFTEMSSSSALEALDIHFLSNVQYSGFWRWLWRFTNGPSLITSQIKDSGS